MQIVMGTCKQLRCCARWDNNKNCWLLGARNKWAVRIFHRRKPQKIINCTSDTHSQITPPADYTSERFAHIYSMAAVMRYQFGAAHIIYHAESKKWISSKFIKCWWSMKLVSAKSHQRRAVTQPTRFDFWPPQRWNRIGVGWLCVRLCVWLFW